MKNKLPVIIPVIICLFFSFNCRVGDEGGDVILGNLDHLGMDSEVLSKAFQAAKDRGFVYALIVLRRGETAGEMYFGLNNESSFHSVKSVSKSFLSILVGIAESQGYISNLDNKVMVLFPEYGESDIDRRFFDITWRHLLTMQSGLDSDQNIFSRIYGSSNWLDATFHETLTFDPGSKMGYSTPSTHILACALSRLIGKNLKEYADQYLFGPLGITVDRWAQDPQGNYNGGNDMYFQPRELVRFGQLIIQRGNWNGAQIIPSKWVEKSLMRSRPNTGSSWGVLTEVGYGYLWWLGKINGYPVYTALGYGGQFVLVIPDLELLVVTESDSGIGWDAADEHERAILDIISKYVIPSVIE